MDRDQIDTLIQDDYVIVQIDTFNDQRRNFQFRVNPLGVQADALSSEVDRTEDWSWDMIWESKGKITADGYEVEIALPFNQLRFPNHQGGPDLGLRRGTLLPAQQPPPHERQRQGLESVLLGLSVRQDQRPRGARAGPQPGARPDTDRLRAPTSSTTFPDGDLVEGDEDTEAGLTARWGVTPNLTLTGTINPDFSQVEADVAQLNLNERFALFFEEKRPFFLEGISSFNTPNRIVFTRTVVDPDWGFKLAGKQGRNGFGLFAAEDAVNSLVFPSNQGSRLDAARDSRTSGVLRYRRDVGASSALGLVYTGREATATTTASSEWTASSVPATPTRCSIHYLRSDTLYPQSVAEEFGQPVDAFDDDFWEIRYEFDTRKWNFAVDYEDYGPGFRADSGFVPRVDILKAQMIGTRRFWGDDDDWYDQWDVGRLPEPHRGSRRPADRRDRPTLHHYQRSAAVVIDLNVKRRKEYFNGVLYEDLDGAGLWLRRSSRAARSSSRCSPRSPTRSTSPTIGRPTSCSSTPSSRPRSAATSTPVSITHCSDWTWPAASCSRPT